jgi:hypothetical protein
VKAVNKSEKEKKMRKKNEAQILQGEIAGLPHYEAFNVPVKNRKRSEKKVKK